MEPRQEYQSDNFATYFNLGVDLRQKGDRQGAIEAWTQTLCIEPSNTHAYYYRGITKAEIGDFTGAIEDFRQVLQFNPKYFNAYRQLDKIYQKILDDSQASQPISPDAIVYYQRGKFHFQRQEYQKAIEDFNQALQFNPNLAKAYYNRGKSRHKLKDKEGFIEDLQKAAQLFCSSNQVEELAKWSPFELGESSRKEAINYLIQHLYSNKSYDSKRTAASGIRKLASRFKDTCELAIPYLLDNLSDPAPQVRQYALKALEVLTLPDSAIQTIKDVAQNDPKDYNRGIAQIILKNLKGNTPKVIKYSNNFERDKFLQEGSSSSIGYLKNNNIDIEQYDIEREDDNELVSGTEDRYLQDIYHDLSLEGEDYTESSIRAEDGWFYRDEDYSNYKSSESSILNGGTILDEFY